MKNSKQKEVKEGCPKCGSTKFAKSLDASEKRYCQGCGHVWLPMSKAEITLQIRDKEIAELKEQVKSLREQLSALSGNRDSKDTDIFS